MLTFLSVVLLLLISLVGVFSASAKLRSDSIRSVKPNDPEFFKQWSHKITKTNKAWRLTRGSRNVRVGVIDELATKDAELKQNLVERIPYASALTNGAATNGPSLDLRKTRLLGDPTHGTLVSGILGAKGNNGRAVAGVNWNLQILNFEGCVSGGCPDRWVSEAIDRAGKAGLPIVNMSFGSYREMGRGDHIERAMASYPETLFVVAAGNDRINLDILAAMGRQNVPCFELPNVICVGASNRKDRPAYFSNFGRDSVDLYAPGDDLLSPGKNRTWIVSGTSFAAPYVAGAASLALSVDPTLNPVRLKKLILQSVDRRWQFRESRSGGRLNTLCLLLRVKKKSCQA